MHPFTLLLYIRCLLVRSEKELKTKAQRLREEAEARGERPLSRIPPNEENYSFVARHPLILAPAGCKRPRVKCGSGHASTAHSVGERRNNIAISGRGKWFWVGPDCDQKPVQSFLISTFVGHTFHLVDEGVVTNEVAVKKEDQFLTSLPCHKNTMEINCGSKFIGVVPSIGMHVLCFAKERVCVYRDGYGVCELLGKKEYKVAADFAIAMNLKLTNMWDRLRLYAEDGTFISKYQDENMLILFEGGVWQWPAMHLHYRRAVHVGDRTLILETKSVSPAIFEIKKMMDDDEINSAWNTVEPLFQNSTIGQGDQIKDNKVFRSSSTAFLPPTHVDDTLLKFYKRVQTLVRSPLIRAEHMQVLQYKENQFYKPHMDCLNDNLGQSDRYLTLFTYFQNVSRGGGTGFPDTRNAPNVMDSDLESCSKFQFFPEKGKSLLFYSRYPNGFLNAMSRHAGCPVLQGEKRSGNFWFWNGFHNDQGKMIWNNSPEIRELSRPYWNDEDAKFVLHQIEREAELRREDDIVSMRKMVEDNLKRNEVNTLQANNERIKTKEIESQENGYMRKEQDTFQAQSGIKKTEEVISSDIVKEGKYGRKVRVISQEEPVNKNSIQQSNNSVDNISDLVQQMDPSTKAEFVSSLDLKQKTELLQKLSKDGSLIQSDTLKKTELSQKSNDVIYEERRDNLKMGTSHENCNHFTVVEGKHGRKIKVCADHYVHTSKDTMTNATLDTVHKKRKSDKAYATRTREQQDSILRSIIENMKNTTQATRDTTGTSYRERRFQDNDIDHPLNTEGHPTPSYPYANQRMMYQKAEVVENVFDLPAHIDILDPSFKILPPTQATLYRSQNKDPYARQLVEKELKRVFSSVNSDIK